MTFTAMGHCTAYTEGEVKEVGWLATVKSIIQFIGCVTHVRQLKIICEVFVDKQGVQLLETQMCSCGRVRLKWTWGNTA